MTLRNGCFRGAGLAGALVVLMATAAMGQQARFAEPAAAEVARGEAVSLSLVDADGAQSWTEHGAEYFLARTAWSQDNRDAVPVAPLSRGLEATWVAGEPGVLLLGVDLAARDETVSTGSFVSFVERVLPASRRGALGGLLATDDPEGMVVVRRVESCKALVRVEEGDDAPVSIATSKTGQVVEIRPLMDPTAIVPGSDLAVRVYSRVPGPADGLVIATNVTTGETVRAPTNATSLAVIPIGEAGRWRLEFHAVEPAEAGADTDEEGTAEWTVHTATLTFDVGEMPEAGEAGR